MSPKLPVQLANTDALTGRSRERYRQVLQSPGWKQLRVETYKRQQGRCGDCNKAFPLKLLEQHHKHYDTLGKETSEDVVLLCQVCHLIADRRRIIRQSIQTFCDKYFLNTGHECPDNVLVNFITRKLMPSLPTFDSRGISPSQVYRSLGYKSSPDSTTSSLNPSTTPTNGNAKKKPLRYINLGNGEQYET